MDSLDLQKNLEETLEELDSVRKFCVTFVIDFKGGDVDRKNL